MVQFFDDQSNPQEAVNPTLTATLKNVLKSMGQQMRVCMPATIVSYDYKKQQATVQPTFANQYNDGTVSTLPQVFNVPVQWPSSGNGYMHFPLKKGDRILLHFSDKALDQWLAAGAIAQPTDSRTHHIADAIATPGCRPFNETIRVSNGSDVIIGHKNLEFRLKPNGRVQVITGLNTSNSTELLHTIDNFMSAAISGNLGGMITAQHFFRRFLQS